MLNNKKLAALVLGAAIALGGAAHAAETTGQYIDDTTVTTKVKAALVADKGLSANDITVNTTHGVVTLTGNVDTQSQYSLAASDAASVAGAKSVANMLTVRQAAAQ